MAATTDHRARFVMRKRAKLLVAVVALASCAPSASPPTPSPSPTPSVTPSASATPTPRVLGKGRTEQGSFHSAALGRTMQYIVYLPPGYDANPSARFPSAYMLHGGSGYITEWIDYGLLDAADRLMGSGAIPPFVIVFPEGDQEYWVDHVVDRRTGANGEKWGTYTARDVVPTIDARYRTIARPEARSIGGLSMGGHGAMQLPMNFPGVWSVIGAHSPALRPEGDAPTYLGSNADFAARDPFSLVGAKPQLARTYRWWIDTGDVDPWREPATAIHDELAKLGIGHDWHLEPGDHSAAYWDAHVEDYLRYYAAALCRPPVTCLDR